MVECMIWDHDAAGSSPVSPTIQTHTANLKIQSLCYWFESNYAAFRVLINWQIKRMINVSSIQPRSVTGNTFDFDSNVVGSNPAGAAT